MGAVSDLAEVCNASSEAFDLAVLSASDDDEFEVKNSRLILLIAALRIREECQGQEPTLDTGCPVVMSVSATMGGGTVSGTWPLNVSTVIGLGNSSALQPIHPDIFPSLQRNTPTLANSWTYTDIML